MARCLSQDVPATSRKQEDAMKPRVSVIIATYNRETLLKRAIDSVLSQTFDDYELIVVDDGSSDGTAELVRGYERVKYLRQENQGKSIALNNALKVAAGEWVAFLDSDDYWLPEKLGRQIRILDDLQDSGCGACFTDGQFMNNPAMNMTVFEFYGRKYDGASGLLPNPVATLADSSAGISVVTLLCRADVIRKVGGFDPLLRFTEDYDFVFRLALVTSYCFVNLPLVMIDRSAPTSRHTGSSAVWDKPEFRLQCEQYRCEKWLTLVADQPREVRRIILRRLRCVHSAWANWHLSKEQYQLARKELGLATRCDVTSAILVKRVIARIAPALTRSIVLKRQPSNPGLMF
jgi:glycosyltransferase involved in cell wall biosynthesis